MLLSATTVPESLIKMWNQYFWQIFAFSIMYVMGSTWGHVLGGVLTDGRVDSIIWIKDILESFSHDF